MFCQIIGPSRASFRHVLTLCNVSDMGNKFVWHEDNTFTFIINSLKTDDKLKIEVYNTKDKVYNTKDKVGEYE